MKINHEETKDTKKDQKKTFALFVSSWLIFRRRNRHGDQGRSCALGGRGLRRRSGRPDARRSARSARQWTARQRGDSLRLSRNRTRTAADLRPVPRRRE